MLRSIDEGFSTFLAMLSPLTSEHDKGRSHKDSVKRCLTNRFDLYKIFETGSFGSGTGIRHYSDTDYFAVLNATNVSPNSTIILRRTKEGLQQTFIRTRGIEVKSPAVSIQFGKYRSETLEITPCVYAGIINGHPAYRIPDGDGGWIASSPVAHKQYVQDVDNQLGNQLKPLIQLVKAWKYYNNLPIKSFYLELFIASSLINRRKLDLPLDLHKILLKLCNSRLKEVNDPMKVSGLIPATNTVRQRDLAISKLSTAAGRSAKAIDLEKKGDLHQAFYYWNLLFSNHFPSR
jgi:hypothetical protein